MMTEADYYALFEAYADGELAGARPRQPRSAPGGRPGPGPALRRLCEMTATLRAYGQRQQARQQLRGIHAAMLAADAPEEVTLPTRQQGPSRTP